MGNGLIEAEVPWKETFSLAFHAKSEFSLPLTLKGKSFLYLREKKKRFLFQHAGHHRKQTLADASSLAPKEIQPHPSNPGPSALDGSPGSSLQPSARSRGTNLTSYWLPFTGGRKRRGLKSWGTGVMWIAGFQGAVECGTQLSEASGIRASLW